MKPISKTVGAEIDFKIDPTDDGDVSREVIDINWKTDGDGVLNVADDKKSAKLMTTGTPGVNNVSVSGNPDLTGVGTDLLTDSCEVTTTAVPIPEATKLNLSGE